MKIKWIFSGILALIILSGATFQAFSQEKKENKVFEKVELMPKFQGKDIKHFNQWVMKNIQYPKDSLKEGISGKVYVGFVVASDGSVTDVKVKRSVHEYLDKEVVRVVKSSPAWTPGKNKGKAVDVAIAIPVDFKLSN